MGWYKTGTVSVTQGSNAVIGTGTSFIANARVGDAFRGPDGEWYEVTNIASDTALSIAPNYQGPTAGAGVYALAPMQGYVKDSADALRAATSVIASGVADMQEQVAAATEAAESAGQSKSVATEQAGIATSAANASTENKDASSESAGQSQSSAQAAGAAAGRAESARDSVVQSEAAAAESARAAKESADHAEEVTRGKAASGANNDITSLGALTAAGYEGIRQGIAPMVGATATAAGKKGLAPAGAPGDQDKFLTAGGVYKEAGAALPVGSIQPWGLARTNIPSGWIPRDGQILNRADWPDLWALYSAVAIDDSAWLAAPYDKRGLPSKGNGTTTFRMPDTNGKATDGNTIAAMFLRGDGKSSAGSAGFHQADQLQDFRITSENYRATDKATASRYMQMLPGNVFNVGQTASANSDNYIFNSPTQMSGYYYLAPSLARVGSETRTSNETVIWCTVGAGKTVNPGTVDVIALATTVSQQSSTLSDIQSKQVITRKWVSVDTAWTNAGTLVINHTLSAVPVFGIIRLKYKQAVNGMAVGEFSMIASNTTTVAGAGNFGIELRKLNASTVTLQIASSGIYSTSTAGGATAVTPAQVDLQLELWA